MSEWVLFPGEAKVFLLMSTSRQAMGTPQPTVNWKSSMKWPEHVSDNSVEFSAEVRGCIQKFPD